uniref:Ig-like domain-containing protein n=1 Tax=Glossina brevipalpis TaxID=37001 RepID=A0A1A9X2A9_9MUSC
MTTVSVGGGDGCISKHTRGGGGVGDTAQTSVEDSDMPRFAEPVANVTVSVGRDALLACVVENLKGYKVAWVRVDTQTILSIHHNVISQNNRISLTYNDHRSWYLHIKEVEETDRGWYMCQVNTDPMRSRKGYLQVVVPPMIVESMTSNDMVVREGLNVTLMCKARGYPEPYVMWRREDGEEMLIGGEHVNVVDGELLLITKVSRLHMAAYLCVASNGVPPSISKRVHLRVQFPPMLSIPNQLEGAYIGQDVVLECHTEAYPASINYWTTERGDMIISDTSRAGDKYETTSTVSGYTKYMKLKIRNVGPNDFGTYRCVAKNSLGETDGNIKLDEMPTPTTAIISEMAMLNRSLDGNRRNRNKLDSNALPDYGVEEWRDGAGTGSSNNNHQASMRNPPDAFHNSACGLAEYNLLNGIIQAFKMQLSRFLKVFMYYAKNAMKTLKTTRDKIETIASYQQYLKKPHFETKKIATKTTSTSKILHKSMRAATKRENNNNKKEGKNMLPTMMLILSTALRLTIKQEMRRNHFDIKRKYKESQKGEDGGGGGTSTETVVTSITKQRMCGLMWRHCHCCYSSNANSKNSYNSDNSNSNSIDVCYGSWQNSKCSTYPRPYANCQFQALCNTVTPNGNNCAQRPIFTQTQQQQIVSYSLCWENGIYKHTQNQNTKLRHTTNINAVNLVNHALCLTIVVTVWSLLLVIMLASGSDSKFQVIGIFIVQPKIGDNATSSPTVHSKHSVNTQHRMDSVYNLLIVNSNLSPKQNRHLNAYSISETALIATATRKTVTNLTANIDVLKFEIISRLMLHDNCGDGGGGLNNFAWLWFANASQWLFLLSTLSNNTSLSLILLALTTIDR